MWLYNVIILLLCTVLISHCKECTTPSKPHLSRCDMYFKCQVLPSKTLVWIPSQCDRGLIYEPGLHLCVMPADDWECLLGDQTRPALKDDQNVYGVDNLEYLKNEVDSYQPQAESEEEESVLMISSDGYDSPNVEVVQDFAVVSGSQTPNDQNLHIDESSGDGEPKEDDGSKEQTIPQLKTDYVAVPITPDQQGSVASHLQRLSQLIQSMRNAQQNMDQNQSLTELTANDLNTFLANYNIKNGFQHQVQPLGNVHKHELNRDGKIPADRLREILRLQQKIQKLNSNDEQPAFSHTISLDAPESTQNNKFNLDPIKTVRLSGNGVSAAQIVVNRPEGSVLFSLPGGQGGQQPNQNQNQQHMNPSSDRDQNYISQDTLKAVLDLSKQMIASNNQQQMPNYLQPIFRPVYYNVPIHDVAVPFLSSYKPKEDHYNLADDDEVDDKNLDKIASVAGHAEASGDDRTTVIHNHIPITIQNRKATKPLKLPATAKPAADDQNIESVTETRYDSFGGKVVTKFPTQPQRPEDRIPYPPYTEAHSQQFPNYNLNSNPTFVQQAPQLSNPLYTNYQNYPNYGGYSQVVPNHSQQNQQQFAYNTYSNQQYPGNYPTANYPANPHLSDFNVNNYVTVDTPAYPTLRPTAASQFNSPNNVPNRIPPQPQSTNNYNRQQTSDTTAPTGGEAPSIGKYDEDDNNYDADNGDYADEEHDVHDLDSNAIVINGLSSSGYSGQYQPPYTVASNAANLESKQSLESVGAHSIANGNGGPVPESDTRVNNNVNSSPASSNKNTIVHYGNTYMTYQDYQQSVAPLLREDVVNTIELLPCVTGARQRNSADCTKYFVCNASTKKVLDYVCPQFTAFNSDTRFCDAKTYSECRGVTTKSPPITVDRNRLLFQQAEQAKQTLREAQRLRLEALQNQQLAAKIKQQTQTIYRLQQNTTPRPAAALAPTRRVTSSKPAVTYAAPTAAPRPQRPAAAPRKRLIKCTEPTKVRDTLSVYNYFTCFKGPDGTLKALKQTCPGGLVFCARSKMCTVIDRC